jgi:hypothetical protein
MLHVLEESLSIMEFCIPGEKKKKKKEKKKRKEKKKKIPQCCMCSLEIECWK